MAQPSYTHTLKTNVLFAGLLTFTALRTTACDYCGIFLNVQPHDRTSQFGLFWRVRTLHGSFAPTGGVTLRHGDTSTTSSTPTVVTEMYQTIELRSDLRLGDRWFLLGSVPLVNNYRSVNGYMKADLYGVGDPLALARYQVANTKCLSDTIRTVHRLLLGAGMKFPLGRTDMTFQSAEVDRDLQPGTGTWDALFSAEYTVRRNDNGLAMNSVVRWNGTRMAFHPGNGVNLSAEFFHRWNLGGLVLLPSLGAYGEWSAPDREEGAQVEGTGGSTVFAHAGSRFWWREWMFTLAYQRAVADDQGDQMVPNRDRMILGVSYLLTRN